VIDSGQLRAARALLRIDQRMLAGMAGVSLPTVQRMEASRGNMRGVVETVAKIAEPLDAVELIGNEQPSQGRGRGVRLKEPA
jgi:predicted transcriptional regulator